jgi:membrane protease YdiL (CAAX protease family)
MIPNDPQRELPLEGAEASPVVLPPQAAADPSPWRLADIAVFLCSILPTLLITLIVIQLARPLGEAFQLLIGQLVLYVLIVGSLYLVLRLRYDIRFWSALGWKSLPFRPTLFSLAGGPVLATVIGILGAIFRTPEVPLPFQEMLLDRSTIFLTGIFVVALGPICEELVFRGFMQPAFVRALGVLPGISLSGALFGLAHGYEYQWLWQYIALISVAGAIFGWVRHKTGSTAAAAFMHGTFNLAQFAAFIARAHSSHTL